MKNWLGSLFISLLSISLSAHAVLDISSPTTVWSAITYGTNSPDTFIDQQTGLKSGDLVGDANHPAFYTKFDDAGTPDLTDDTIAFRARLNEVKNYSKLVFDYNLFVGLDANLDGALDLFVGIDNSPSGSGALSIWLPGTGANTSPSTTTIINPPVTNFTETAGVNYSFVLVTAINDPAALTYDVDGGGNTDAFLSFSIAFNSIVSVLSSRGINITQDSPINYVMATATQSSSLNMDLNGVGASGIGSALTWGQLGAVSDTFSPTGESIPEPSAVGLFTVGCLCLRYVRRFTDPTRPSRG